MTVNQPTNLNRTNQGFNMPFWQKNWPMIILIIGSLLFLAISVVGLLTDSTQIVGENAWIKPMKFGISSAIYGITLLWMMQFLDESKKRVTQIAAWIISLGLIIELAAIYLQAYRGIRSHFNITTQLNANIYSLMGTTIFLIWVCTIIIGVRLLQQDIQPTALGASIRWGLLASIIGMALAFLMISSTPQQIASQEAGEPVVELGAHSVGVDDGGAGLPFVGWSTTGGDLRIGHFVGLHGLQVLPLLGLWLSNRPVALPAKKQRRLIALAGIGYIGTTFLLTWQALRGQSIIAPDALMLIVTFALMSAVLIPFLIIYKK